MLQLCVMLMGKDIHWSVRSAIGWRVMTATLVRGAALVSKHIQTF